jgi:hypothetical protein
MIEYFTQANPPFGNISIVMTLLWLATLGLGAYLLRSYRSQIPLRLRFVRQAAIITLVLSLIGVGLMVLKYLQVPVFEWRLWGYLAAFASLGYWGWALYYYNSKLPAQVAVQAGRGARASRGARTYAANVTPPPARPAREPRPVATTTRREARRDKKRKTR